MKRDLAEIEKHSFDLVIVGGGIYGACVAWEATLRGLSVALLEKEDFGSATSANSLKIIHGGFRYLQNLDFDRIRESIRERRILSQIAPHLIHPLPVLIPTYGHGIKGREVMSFALPLYDLIGFDRNRLDDPQKRIPNGRTISRSECLRLVPGIPEQGLTGGAIFYDAQVYSSERLILAYIHSAERAGAQIANYARVTGLLVQGDKVAGLRVVDALSGDSFDVRARLVVNAAGPWIDQVRSFLNHGQPRPELRLARAINVITRPLFKEFAVGIPGDNGYQDSVSVARKKSSFLFVAPWRDRSIIGTIYAPYSGDPEAFHPSQRDLQAVLNAFNQAYPPAGLSEKDVTFVHAGLLPMTGERPGSGAVDLMKHFRLYDQQTEGIPGLISVIGVKYTTARDVAQRVVDRAFELRGQTSPVSRSASMPLVGGEIDKFGDFLDSVISQRPCGLEPEDLRDLVYNYGSVYPEVLGYFQSSTGLDPVLSAQETLLQAQVRYAVKEEMAQKLSDIVFRRTGLGSAGHPGQRMLELTAATMSAILGWDPATARGEIEAVNQAYQLG